MEFRELVPRKVNTVILPVGTMEAHGVIPLATDTYIPEEIGRRIAPGLNALLAPPVYYGITRTLLPYPGSVTVGPRTFEDYIYEVGLGFADAGFQRLVVLNGHGGHITELRTITHRLWEARGLMSVAIHWWMLVDDICQEIYGMKGGHAAVDETAAILALDPDLVQRRRYRKSLARVQREGVSAYPAPSSIILYKDGEGHLDFDVEKARAYLDKTTERVLEAVKEVFAGWGELAGHGKLT
jgi:creatinine amidohydrolase